MENVAAVNFEDEFVSLCRKYDCQLEQVNEGDGLSATEVDALLSDGHQWASDFLSTFGVNDIESYYDEAIRHELEQICLQADRNKTLTGQTTIAIGLSIIAQHFKVAGRAREACKYMAMVCAYLERERDLLMLLNFVELFTEVRKKAKRSERGRKGGIGKNKKFAIIRTKVIELLATTERPAGGWVEINEAYKAIDGSIREFITKEFTELEEDERRQLVDTLSANVLRWAWQRDEVREAFNKVVIRKKI